MKKTAMRRGAKSKRKYVYTPAFDDASARDKGTVVSAQRARWKEAHDRATPQMMRMVRFVWMRRILWTERFKLHSTVLGACLRAGLLTYTARGYLVSTDAGDSLLHVDRERGTHPQ